MFELKKKHKKTSLGFGVFLPDVPFLCPSVVSKLRLGQINCVKSWAQISEVELEEVS